ncbi:MAG: tRNA adenosine(34) deaminase TadA [Desulfobacteraceae bacterium]
MNINTQMDDEFYMKLALAEAAKALKLEEVPVGAVLVNKEKKIIGYGYNQPVARNDPTAHAEIMALRMGAETTGNYRLPGTILYATVEPCIMCMGAIIHARVSRLVYGAKDPKWGGAGSLYDFSSDNRLNHHPVVVSGVYSDEAGEIIRTFFRNKRSK